MNFLKNIAYIALIFLNIIESTLSNNYLQECVLYESLINNPLRRFIRTISCAGGLAEDFYHDFDIILNKILISDPKKKDFLYILDSLFFIKSFSAAIINNYLFLGKDLEIKEKLHLLEQNILTCYLKNFVFNSDVFNKITDAYNYWQDNNDQLTEEEQRFIDGVYNNFKKMGAHLSKLEKEQLIQFQAQALNISSQMQMNIMTCRNGFWVSKEELLGVSQKFLETLRKNDDGLFWIGVDYLTYEHIMKYCTIRQTRKKLYTEFSNRGYPENESLMKSFFNIMQQEASLLGFCDAAHADITSYSTMAKSVEAVEKFLLDMNNMTRNKAQKEIDVIKEFAKEEFGIENLFPWDLEYYTHEYSKKHLKYDEKVVTEYLPITHCIEKILEIYSAFLNINLKLCDYSQESCIDEDRLKKIVVKDLRDTILGEIILDLFPRDDKYVHACTSLYVAPCINDFLGDIKGICFLIVNCIAPTKLCDGFFTMTDLTNFFHELGHAIHFVLGKTHFYSGGSFEVPVDFVELPPQIFEQWMDDPDVLKNMSKHYSSGECIPDDLIKKIIADKYLMIGCLFQNMLYYSFISLYGFLRTDCSLKDIAEKCLDTVATCDKKNFNTNIIYSFMHVCDYGARYYSYVWALIYALDVFSYIKKNNGLFDQEIGERFKNIILTSGASRDYTKILEEFIGRTLSQKQFYQYVSIFFDI